MISSVKNEDIKTLDKSIKLLNPSATNERMKMPNIPDLSPTDDFDDSHGIGRITRFKATRAIINTQIRAKMSDRTLMPKTIVCHHLPVPRGFFKSDE